MSYQGPSWSGQDLRSHRQGHPTPSQGALAETPGFGRRTSASLIDAIATVIYLGLTGTWLAVAATIAGKDIEDEAVANTIALAMYLFGLTSHFAAFWYFNATGRSLGKSVVGLRVVAPDGGRPGPSRGLGRTAGAYISLLALGIGYLWGAFDGRSQSWHDKIGDTFVVRDRPQPFEPAPYG